MRGTVKQKTNSRTRSSRRTRGFEQATAAAPSRYSPVTSRARQSLKSNGPCVEASDRTCLTSINGCYEFLLTLIEQFLPFLRIGSPLRLVEVCPRLAPVIFSIGELRAHFRSLWRMTHLE